MSVVPNTTSDVMPAGSQKSSCIINDPQMDRQLLEKNLPLLTPQEAGESLFTFPPHPSGTGIFYWRKTANQGPILSLTTVNYHADSPEIEIATDNFRYDHATSRCTEIVPQGEQREPIVWNSGLDLWDSFRSTLLDNRLRKRILERRAELTDPAWFTSVKTSFSQAPSGTFVIAESPQFINSFDLIYLQDNASHKVLLTITNQGELMLHGKEKKRYATLKDALLALELGFSLHRWHSLERLRSELTMPLQRFTAAAPTASSSQVIKPKPRPTSENHE